MNQKEYYKIIREMKQTEDELISNKKNNPNLIGCETCSYLSVENDEDECFRRGGTCKQKTVQIDLILKDCSACDCADILKNEIERLREIEWMYEDLDR